MENRTVNIAPESWSQTVNLLAVLIREATPQGRDEAVQELRRMAEVADLYVASQNKSETQERLERQVQDIAQDISGWLEGEADEDELTADMCAGVLECRYVVSATDEVLEVQLLLAYGGPNIWADINSDGRVTVRGYWGSAEASATGYGAESIFDYFAEAR